MSAYWFGLAYLWNGLHTILLPVMLIGLVPVGLKNTFLGGLTFAGLLLAMLVQPMAGAISDRSGWLGRFGKRRPWIAFGASADVVFLLVLAWAADFWLLVIGYIGLQAASSFAEAALQGLLPDLVPADQRGRGAGFKNAAQIAGFVAGVGLGGWLAGQGHVKWALAVTALVLLASAAWTWLGVHEVSFHRRRRGLAVGDALRRVFVDSFRFDHRLVPGYGRLLAGRALLMAGFFALQGFAQYFVADVLAVDNPASVTALLMAIMGGAIFLLAVPTGSLADRVGRRPLNLLAGAMGALATLALVFVSNVPQLVIAGGLVGASIGVFLSVNWAWAADLVPPEDAGRYLGLSNLATAGAGAFSRLFAGPIVDSGNALHVGLGYHVLFVILACGMAAGTYVLAGVPETRAARSAAVAASQRTTDDETMPHR
jgi:MFS family permease